MKPSTVRYTRIRQKYFIFCLGQRSVDGQKGITAKLAFQKEQEQRVIFISFSLKDIGGFGKISGLLVPDLMQYSHQSI